MKFKKIILAVGSLLKAKILQHHIPLTVSWALTYRCNSQCLYCQIWNINLKELDTKTTLSILDDLVAQGMQWITFTGGEPLLRDDIGEIIDYASKKGIYTSISSNGILLGEKIFKIKNINRINLSFDGPEKVHDLLRGEGSHYKAIEAIKIGKNNDIQIILNTVLCKYNLNYIDYILNIAEQYRIKVFFQPASLYTLGIKVINPAVPPEEEYKWAIIKLIAIKREQNNNIFNSIAGLKHLYYYPKPKNISCLAGRLHFRIEPDGGLYPCGRVFINKGSQDIIKLGVKEAMRGLIPPSCSYCWCASLVEFNLATSLNLSAIFNILNQM